MTTTLTLGQLQYWRQCCETYEELYKLKGEPDTSTIADRLQTSLLEVLAICESVMAERDFAIIERDQALARVKELELQRGDYMAATANMRGHVQPKLDAAFARVAVLREAIKNGIECCEPSRVDGILSRAIHGEDQAAEALLAERDALKAMVAELKQLTRELAHD